jgi:hypothetical protein
VAVAATRDDEERLSGSGSRLLRLSCRGSAEECEWKYEKREEAQGDEPG